MSAIAVALGSLLALALIRDNPVARSVETPVVRSHAVRPSAPGALTGRLREHAVEPTSQRASPSARGFIEVVVKDEQGRRVAPGASLLAHRIGAGCSKDWPVCTEKGATRIGDLPIGGKFKVVVDPTETHDGGHVIVHGPTHQGETVKALVKVRTHPTFSGLLVDESSRVFANTQVCIVTMYGDLDPRGEFVTKTDARGHFAWTDSTSRLRGGGNVLRVTKYEEQIDRVGKVRVDHNPTGDVDVGVIVLRPTGTVRFVARGRVVDGFGSPLWRNAVVTASREGRYGRNVSRIPIQVLRDGTFEIYTGLPDISGPIEIVGKVVGKIAVRQTIELGADDVTLRLLPGATIRGTCHLPTGLPDWSLGVALRMGEEPCGRSFVYKSAFRLRGLKAGRYDATIKVWDSSWDLEHVDGVSVRSGAVAADARLLDIDLTDRVRTFQLQLNQPDGTRLSGTGQYVTLRTDDGKHARCKVDGHGLVTVVSPSRYDTFAVEHPNGTAEVRWAPHIQTVRLHKSSRR